MGLLTEKEELVKIKYINLLGKEIEWEIIKSIIFVVFITIACLYTLQLGRQSAVDMLKLMKYMEDKGCTSEVVGNSLKFNCSESLDPNLNPPDIHYNSSSNFIDFVDIRFNRTEGFNNDSNVSG